MGLLVAPSSVVMCSSVDERVISLSHLGTGLRVVSVFGPNDSPDNTAF